MNKMLTLARYLGLIEEHVIFDKAENMPKDVLVIPPGSLVEGQLHTSMAVIVAGEMDGSINIKGDAKLVILKNAEIKNGLVSANCVEIHGVARHVSIDADRLSITETGKIEGKSEVRYGRLVKHENAPVNGRFDQRKSPRDGFAHQVSPSVDVLSS